MYCKIFYDKKERKKNKEKKYEKGDRKRLINVAIRLNDAIKNLADLKFIN